MTGDPTQCQTCDTGNLYNLTTGNQCVLCTVKDDNCTSVDNTGNILSCGNNLVPQSDAQSCVTPADNCITPDNIDVSLCDNCNTTDLYYLGTGDQCVLCTTINENCTGVLNDGTITSCSGD